MAKKPGKNELFGPTAKLIKRSGAEEARKLAYDLSYKIKNPKGFIETRIMCKVGKYYFDHTLVLFKGDGSRDIKPEVKEAIRKGKEVDYTYFHMLDKISKGKGKGSGGGRASNKVDPRKTVKALERQKKKRTKELKNGPSRRRKASGKEGS